MHRPRPSIVAPLVILASGWIPDAAAGDISYNRDVRPILAEHCFGCHGADSAGRKAGLRLDQREAAVESGAIDPGDPDSSALLDRIFSADPDEVMPPPATKKTLTPAQKDLLSRWIKGGAEYQPHWSFIAPVRPAAPAVVNEAWVRNPIDRFILARLEQEGLAAAPEASRRTLARRAALDLTGLPPEPADVEALVADTRPDAYERYVDALLEKPKWGEHRGRHWLDYARYADTHGIHFDNFREMWAYRQWVIDAFNTNLPFDRFTILQLAGDLAAQDLDGSAALDARIATGLHRCTMTTNEGGVIDEEYLVLYARDRTETTAAVWMGLTAGCAVCHDHKFDPITMRDFYALSAFFNNTAHGARDGNIKDTPPVVVVPQHADRDRFAEVERDLAAGRRMVEERRRDARPEFDRWITGATAEVIRTATPEGTPLVALDFAAGGGTSTRAMIAGKAADLSLTAATTRRVGPCGSAAVVLDGPAVEIEGCGDFEHDQAFSATFWLRPPGNDSFYAVISRMDEAKESRGWDVFVQGRRVGLNMIHEWPGDALRQLSVAQLPTDAWTFVAVTYDGSGGPGGVKVFLTASRRSSNS